MTHWIHPFFVHFSVAFLVAGAALEAWGAVRREDSALASPLVIAGTISLVATLASGYLAANAVTLSEAARPLLAAHERNGWFVLGVFVSGLFGRAWIGRALRPGERALYATWLTFGAALALRSAWFGGRMVYEQGVGVGL